MADVYVDFSAANDGDGTAYNQAASGGATGAFNTLAGKTFTTGDLVWLRRVTRGSDYSSSIVSGVAGVIFIGWPISGDAYYSTRPAGAQATWDADGDNHAKFSFTSSTNFQFNANNIETHRLYVLSKTAGVSAVTYGSVTGGKLYNCIYENNAASCTCAGINLTSSNTGFVISGCEFKFSTWTPSANYVMALAGATCTVSDCTFTVTSATPSGTVYLLHVNAATIYVAGITAAIGTLAGSTGLGGVLVGSSGTSAVILGVSATVTTHSNSASVPALSVQASNILGRQLAINYGNSIQINSTYADIEVTSFTQRHALTSGGVQLTSNAHGCVLSVQNPTFVAGNTTADVLVAGSRSSALIRNGAYQSGTVVSVTGTGSRAISFDHNGTADDLRMYFVDGTVESSNTYRSGGESYSLKITNTNASSVSKGALPISAAGNETMWLSLPSGANTVTIYGAHKNFSSLTASDIWAELQYKDGSDDIQTLTTFDYGGALTSDASTWNNDSGLTLFKLVFSFTLPSDQVVPLRLYGSKYTASAYAYIDPLPVVT